MSFGPHRMVVNYPPDFDGQLNIDCREEETCFTYSFTHAKVGGRWETLVKAAEAIVEQNKRVQAARGKEPTHLGEPRRAS